MTGWFWLKMRSPLVGLGSICMQVPVLLSMLPRSRSLMCSCCRSVRFLPMMWMILDMERMCMLLGAVCGVWLLYGCGWFCLCSCCGWFCLCSCCGGCWLLVVWLAIYRTG